MSVESRSARERILDTAAELFYVHGFHAVGVDLIIERAEVAKTTLYRHFPSKDDLIVTWLERANEQFWSWLDGAVDVDDTPAATLRRLYDEVETLATSPSCLGCAFQVTAAEFPEPGHPAHGVALAHKESVRMRLRELAAEAGAGADDAATLGDALLLLMDGAFAAARMYGPTSPAAHVADAARVLIERMTPAM
jgi:AcrR family transcriptional regulator